MVGPTGSGKTTLLESLPLPRRVPHEGGPSGRVTDWHFFDAGVVVDVAGSLTLKGDLSSDEVGWRRLLALLNRYRPDRPIDGVVLTLSAAELLAWEHRPADELHAIGAGLSRALSQAQRELGVRFPVYVVLTHADRLPGFESFVSAVPGRFHQDVFGWSTPYALESAFRGEWVEEALAEISDCARYRATEVLASRSLLADADAVFRFPDIVKRLQTPTRAILSEIFQQSAYQEAFFLRGIYFTGRRPAAPRNRPPRKPKSRVPWAGAEARPHEPVFGARLFAKKIFPSGAWHADSGAASSIATARSAGSRSRGPRCSSSVCPESG